MGPIYFIEDEFWCLSPYSAHQVTIWGETFATAEHAYQCSRIKPGPERDAIKNAPSPDDARIEGQKWKNEERVMVPNFDKLATMEEIFRAKLAQHPAVASALKKSGDRELVKNVATDFYWGIGDGTGENQMGELWMKLREEVK